jgi:hypothetical protein
VTGFLTDDVTRYFQIEVLGIRVAFTFAAKRNQLVSKWSASTRVSDCIKSVNNDKLIPFIGRHMNLIL